LKELSLVVRVGSFEGETEFLTYIHHGLRATSCPCPAIYHQSDNDQREKPPAPKDEPNADKQKAKSGWNLAGQTGDLLANQVDELSVHFGPPPDETLN
jgi:hypothetical protein